MVIYPASLGTLDIFVWLNVIPAELWWAVGVGGGGGVLLVCTLVTQINKQPPEQGRTVEFPELIVWTVQVAYQNGAIKSTLPKQQPSALYGHPGKPFFK